MQLWAVHTGTWCFHPCFKGSVCHFTELCHCSPCSQQRNVNADRLQTSQPNQAQPLDGTEGWRGLGAVPASVFNFKKLLWNVQNKIHYQEQLPLLLPDNTFHRGNSPEDSCVA